MDYIVAARGLVKTYGEVRALDGLDLEVPAGQVLALLGPNGAGKTTLVRAIATLTRLDTGSLQVAGHDVGTHPEQVRRAIGLAGQYAAVEPALTGRENLPMVARLFGHRRRDARAATERVLEQLGLTEAGDRLVRTYSGGMRRRLDLGASLVGSPRLLLLDEPTTGLDPRSRGDMWDVIATLVRGGTSVLLTTQYLEEADRLADNIVVIDRGIIIAEGTADELKVQVGGERLEVTVAESERVAEAAEILAGIGGGEATRDDRSRQVTVGVTGGTKDLLVAVRRLDEAGIEVQDIGIRRPTLDDAFLAMTGHTADSNPAEGLLRTSEKDTSGAQR